MLLGVLLRVLLGSLLSKPPMARVDCSEVCEEEDDKVEDGSEVADVIVVFVGVVESDGG